MNRIFVTKKPLFITSNGHLSALKRQYNVKKAGFSGILDPFACGALVVAFGQYTKLFGFLEKSPKVYQATLWLGLQSDSLDLENVRNIFKVAKFSYNAIDSVLKNFVGAVEFIPPKYSAKNIQGQKAYALARSGKEADLEILERFLKPQMMQVYAIEFLNYCHPFVSLRVKVSEGAYIRSLGALIAKELGCVGGLSYLERLSEGGLSYDGEKPLNPLEILPFSRIDLRGDSAMRNIFENGKTFDTKMLKISQNSKYIVQFESFFSIISSKNEKVQYLANRIPLC